MKGFQEINLLKKRLDSYKPRPEEKLKASMDKFRIEWTYHSNALEGSTMTLSETSFFMKEGLTSKGKSLSEYIKIIGHLRALKSVDAIIEKGDTLSEKLIKDIHTSLFSDNIAMGEPASDRIVHGSYRCENIHTQQPGGNVHYFTNFSEIPEELRDLIAWFMENKDVLHPVELSARVHHRILAIHPFADGNGRVSRLIMNIILMQNGYTPAIIRVENKAEYLEALYKADKGNCDVLISIVEEGVIETMAHLLNLIEDKEVFGKKEHKKKSDLVTAKADALDIETNKLAKDLETASSECIKELYAILYGQMKCLIEKQNLALTLTGPVQIQDVIGKGFVYYTLNDKNIIPLYDVVEDLLISSKYYVDYISEKGSSMLLEIETEEGYIPASFLSVNIVPIRHAVCIVYVIMIGRIENDEEVLYCKKTDLMQGSYRYNEWKTNKVEDFLIKGFNVFLNEIEKEVAIRRMKMGEKHKNV